MISPVGEEDWQELIAEYGGVSPRPFERIVEVVREGDCQSVVVENRYIDLDYRSEYSAYWSTLFNSSSPFTRRLHFFAEEISEDELHQLSDDLGYLGYSVVRPIPTGPVGRTILKPPPSLSDATIAWVQDSVSLFGKDLKVKGAPFCQQDVEYLRCAHAAAWSCHYVSYKRDLVGRCNTAEIVDMSPTLLMPDRALPSKGMNLNQLQAVFGGMGQPALFYGLSNLPRVPGVPNPTPPEVEPDEVVPAAGHWDTRIISIICRYLNSGFPVLIATFDHAFVLTGWIRENGDVRFIAGDDQIGPYETIESPFDHYRKPWQGIMVPLPPKVMLSGEVAEGEAHKVMRSVASQVGALDWLAEGLLLNGDIELRSRLIKGRVFKRDVAAQTSSNDVLRELRYARLPHWVWIVEAHHRARCHQGPCVVATAVFDSTSPDHAPRMLALSLPGFVLVQPPDGGNQRQVAGSIDPWDSMLVAH